MRQRLWLCIPPFKIELYRVALSASGKSFIKCQLGLEGLTFRVGRTALPLQP